jgi:hypothetical protein
LTDYAQAATKQHKIVPGCSNAEDDAAAAELKKSKTASSSTASPAKKDREVKDSAVQPQGYVSSLSNYFTYFHLIIRPFIDQKLAATLLLL